MAWHSRDRDRKAIEYHYDVSNEFYSLFLDEKIVYSCAYYRSENDSLELAQTQKLGPYSDQVDAAYGFANGWMNVYQVLGSHAENTVGEPLPLTREYMYVS